MVRRKVDDWRGERDAQKRFFFIFSFSPCLCQILFGRKHVFFLLTYLFPSFIIYIFLFFGLRCYSKRNSFNFFLSLLLSQSSSSSHHVWESLQKIKVWFMIIVRCWRWLYKIQRDSYYHTYMCVDRKWN